ncbi:S-layer homology domain-containing protein [Rossellomorea vietnamensis]|uniref:S-layer homology domain-containing protein n=1 Tax=Rossellomorea vietnamensis TaxID=218284 RepID=A0A5D4M1T5_9BACI|nr:S-layer homology domain-containing protein [Rossellomorea vietnamensis]TYR95894.1 S-layer homology domain-containing protein [Rossellomorea vietnamensis]
MKKIVATATAAFLSITMAVNVQADFKDVSHYKEEIQYLEGKNIINGYDDGTFKPESDLKRIQAVQMLLREMGITNFNAPDPDFTDIKPGDYGYEEVAKAVQLGFISGKTAADGSKYFEPWGELTRAQMAKILVEGYDLSEEQRIYFIDANMAHWAGSYVNRIATANITTGYDDSTFRPQETISRQHFSVMMARLLDDRFKKSVDHPSFKPDHSKTFLYQMGPYVSSYTHSHDDLWRQYDLTTQWTAPDLRPFTEAPNGIVLGKPQMSFSYTLGYPVKPGHRWMDQNGQIMTITAVDVTFSTPAGTFRNAVKVEGDSHVEYYAPNVGLLKSTYLPTGEAIAELIEIR